MTKQSSKYNGAPLARHQSLDCHAALAMTLFFVHVSPADFVLAATFAYRSVSLRGMK